MARVIRERSGEDAASLASRALNGATLRPDEVNTLAASVLSQRQIPVAHRRIEAISVDLRPDESSLLLYLGDNSIRLSIEDDLLRELARQCEDMSPP